MSVYFIPLFTLPVIINSPAAAIASLSIAHQHGMSLVVSARM
ncbi:MULTISPECIES: hypothetical protein [unclassified Pseudomonas]|nr:MULTISPECIES: hypothetical protein [unclassified Pseudomonas]